ncbi:MAG: DNA methyltransferase [Patescibacteria group bacterium]|nr:DNA methyltransferase [Patescibacteria group bacterium]MDD5121719.1 DNA methyltransferase [Patescibacteria group bacterium]MDD5221714.1 DNA methyltransferase [Patescibacteria group bacterium]MDD5396117.1 DNA methyltransferase [Patescibacteria group bacterium]
METSVAKSILKVEYVSIDQLKPCEYNPRVWSDETSKNLKESIAKFGLIDPLIVNSALNRKGVVLGGNFRLKIVKELGFTTVPIVWVDIPGLELEKEINLRLNKNTGEFDWNILADFGEKMLGDVGFSSEEMDNIFGIDESPEIFDLKKELDKLNISQIEIQRGDVWQLGNHRLMCGDSTIENDVLRLMGNESADMCFTDPPYLLDYLKGKKKHGEAIEGFGLKRDRKYLETDELPPDFTEKWMANVAKIQKSDFSIIVFENPKNLKTIWLELEKHWKYRNTITWHVPNRCQGFAAKYKFFNKTDIAAVGTQGKVDLNLGPEEGLLQEEYENALYATSGKPHWESYEAGKKYCPTDYIEYTAADEKSSGQGIIFGTKPLEVLIPYLKVLTKRNDLIIEPFGGSGSTLIAAEKMKRRCYLMEKSPVYAEVIRNRWEKLTGVKAHKVL